MTNSNSQAQSGGFPEPPIHILSALSTAVLDWFWVALEAGAALTVVGLPALIPISLTLGGINFILTTLVQRFLAKESWGEAVTKGAVMGVAVGVPFPVVGTIIGGGGAAWTLASLLANNNRPALPKPADPITTLTTTPPTPAAPPAPTIEEGEIIDDASPTDSPDA